MSYLAQTGTPNPTGFLEFWIILAFLLGVLVNIATLYTSLSNRKQRREVTMTEEMTPLQTFRAFTTETASAFSAIRQEWKEERTRSEFHSTGRSNALGEKIEAVRLELDRKIEGTRSQLSDKIDDMPDRVIATLRNTGALQ